MRRGEARRESGSGDVSDSSRCLQPLNIWDAAPCRAVPRHGVRDPQQPLPHGTGLVPPSSMGEPRDGHLYFTNAKAFGILDHFCLGRKLFAKFSLSHFAVLLLSSATGGITGQVMGRTHTVAWLHSLAAFSSTPQLWGWFLVVYSTDAPPSDFYSRAVSWSWVSH